MTYAHYLKWRVYDRRLFLLAKAVEKLTSEGLWEGLQSGEAKFDLSVVFWNGVGSEHVIPNTQRDAEVDAVLFSLRQVIGVMPQVHDGIIQDVLERSVGEVNIGVIQVADRYGDIENDVGLFGCEASDQHHRNVFHGGVEHILHPVIAKVRGKAHFFYRVMDLVELPQPIEAMEHYVGEPLDEIRGNKEYEQLSPTRKGRDIDQCELRKVTAKEIFKSHLCDIRECHEDDQLEDVEVEEHVKGVQPKILTDPGLVLPPWKKGSRVPKRRAKARSTTRSN